MAIIQQIENGKLVDSSASNTSLSTENKSALGQTLIQVLHLF